MRVLHLTEEFPPGIYGGVGTAVGGLVAASARTGIEVAVLLVGAEGDPSYRQPAETRPSSEDPALTQCRAAGVHVRPTSYHAAEEMGVRWAQAWRPDVLHLHSYWLWRMARAMRERTGAPLVYTVHSLVRAEYEIAQGAPECVTAWQTQESAITSADRIVALTRSEGELIATYLPTARKRVRVVGNGIDDCPVAREAANRRHQNDTPLVLYTGRFVERQGIRELLAAIPLVLAREPRPAALLTGRRTSIYAKNGWAGRRRSTPNHTAS